MKNKTQIIESGLIELMERGKLPPSGKLPSLNALAKKFNAHRTTVYRVIQKLEALGYLEIKSGRGFFAIDSHSIKRKLIRNNCISFIIPNMAGAYILELIRGVESILSKEEYFLSIFNSLDDFEEERANLKRAVEIRSKAIILFPVTHATPFCPNNDIYVEIQKTGIPFIFVDNYPRHLDVDYVIANDYQGVYDLTKYIITRGHSKIMFLGGRQHISSCYNRFRGFWQAMADSGLEVDERLTFPNNGVNVKEDISGIDPFLPTLGVKYIKNVLDSDRKPTAIVLSNTISSYLNIIQERAIPNELSIGCRGIESTIGELNTRFVIYKSAKADNVIDITRSSVPPSSLGEKAGQLAIQKIQGKAPKGKNKIKIMVDMSFHEGNSVKRIENHVQNRKGAMSKV